MSESNPVAWRSTGVGHFDADGYAIYPVTSGRKQLSHRDHDELNRLLAGDSAERLYRALHELVDRIELWESGSNIFLPFGKYMLEAKAALEGCKR